MARFSREDSCDAAHHVLGLVLVEHGSRPQSCRRYYRCHWRCYPSLRFAWMLLFTIAPETACRWYVVACRLLQLGLPVWSHSSCFGCFFGDFLHCIDCVPPGHEDVTADCTESFAGPSYFAGISALIVDAPSEAPPLLFFDFTKTSRSTR